MDKLSDLQTVSGVASIDGDRVLGKNQANARYNGNWVVDSGLWRRAKGFLSSNKCERTDWRASAFYELQRGCDQDRALGR